jgi:hypothetical protein
MKILTILQINPIKGFTLLSIVAVEAVIYMTIVLK